MTVTPRAASASRATGLDLVLDRPLPRSLPVGQATAVFCVGSCFHPYLGVDELAIAVDGVRHRPLAQAMPRIDRFRSLHPTLAAGKESAVDRDPRSSRDPELRSYRSGFWATVPIEAQGRPGEIELRAEARLADGTTASAAMGSIDVVERPRGVPLGERSRDPHPLIAVCMATFNPDLELFRIQVESLRAQTDGEWVCLISDDHSGRKRFEAIAATVAGDDRFLLSRSDERLGFYRNFERVLRMVPHEAELVALCDHDDRWYPEKLQTLRAAIGSAELAYSDLRRVDAEGNVRAETLWQGRRNNRANLASLMISNTIVGAACLFRRRVIDHALPFPHGPGWDFHDHWLALVAMALGDVAYVDRPLYDYVQHPGAVLGRVASDPKRSASAERPRLRAWLERRRGFLGRWRSAYFTVYMQRKLQGQVLLARCGPALTARKRRALRLLVAAERSPLAFAWLAVRPARALVGRNETLGLEKLMARGILWRWLIALRGRRRQRPGASGDDASMPSFDPKPLGRSRRRWLARG